MTFFFAALALLLLHLMPGGVKPLRAQSLRKDNIVSTLSAKPPWCAAVRGCARSAARPSRPPAKRYSDSALTPTSRAIADGPNHSMQSPLSVTARSVSRHAEAPYDGAAAEPSRSNGDLQTKSGSRPEASGLNDNGATQATNGDQPSAGPNPHFDIRAFGGYISANPPTTSGQITEGSSILIINAAGDYANGQGIVVYKAGAATTLKTPGMPTITPNLLNGATTWNYRVIAEDYKGGLTAASSAGTTTSGSSTLGLTSFAITSAKRASGVTTYTTPAAHNLRPGQTIMICQFGGGTCPGTFFSTFNGTKVVAATPTSTTFTTNDGNDADGSETPASGQGWVKACNSLTFPAKSFSGKGTLRYWIYRSQGTGAYAIAGVAIGLDPYFVDCGGTAPTLPAYVPPRPPSRAQAGYLATRITSGGGTTKLTLAATAGATLSGVSVLHDNSSALLAAMSAAASYSGGTVYIPSFGPGRIFWSFNSSTDMNSVSAANSNYITILVNGNVLLNQPWILRSNLKIQGMTTRNSNFMYPGGANFGSSSAYPLLYMKKSSSITLRNLFLSGGGAQSTDLFSDTDGNSQGSVGIILENVGLGANSNSGVGTARNAVIKAGFDYFFRQVTCDPASGNAYLPAPCIDFTDSSVAVEYPSQMAGRIAFDNCYIDGSGIEINNVPNPIAHTGDFRITGFLAENLSTPFLRIGPAGIAADFNLVDVLLADTVAGAGTPMIDASGSQLEGVSITGGVGSHSSQPMVISTYLGTSLVATHQPTDNLGNVPYVALRQRSGAAVMEVSNQTLAAFGRGRLNYALALPGAPTSCSVRDGGKVPVGTQSYALTAVDLDGNETNLGNVASLTISSGKQTVTCSLPALPNGAKGFNIYRNAFRIVAGGCSSPQVSGSSFTDTGAGCGNGAPHVNSAGSSSLSSGGVSTYRLRLDGETLSASPRGIVNAFLPGALTSSWTGSTITLDKAVTVTRVQVQAKTAPLGCSTNAIVRLTDGTTPVNVTISGAANDSGAVAQNYAAGATLTLSVQTAAAGCTTSPSDANTAIQYKMQ
jgi:hypothetical protein